MMELARLCCFRSIFNNSKIVFDTLRSHEHGLIVFGNDEQKIWITNNTSEKILNYNIKALAASCYSLVSNLISLEEENYPINQRTIGGNIQQYIIH